MHARAAARGRVLSARGALTGGLALALVAGAVGVATGRGAIQPAADIGAAATPTSVILLVGDGMGVEEITAARYYQGVQNAWNLDRMPYTGFNTTYSVKKGSGPSYLPDYDPDSASAGTQLATGRKTADNRISRGPAASSSALGTSYRTVLESWQARGRKVGLVTTAELTDATPATMSAHITKRVCQGPADMAPCPNETKAAGGRGSIAEQQVDHRVDVLLGGGRYRYGQTIPSGSHAGRTVVEAAQRSGYRYVTTSAELGAVSTGAPVLGLFAEGNLPNAWTGPAATVGKGGAPVPCTERAPSASIPSLATMTSKALGLLSGSGGFFLQVEGASIDKNAHAAKACQQIGETVAFDRAVGVALDYQAAHPDTLVLVTADHGQATQIVNDDWSGEHLPTGYSVNLRTKDGSPLSLTYGTAGYGGGSAPPARIPDMQHTGGAVPIWAVGPGAEVVLGTQDHTSLYSLMGGTSGSPPPGVP